MVHFLFIALISLLALLNCILADTKSSFSDSSQNIVIRKMEEEKVLSALGGDF